MAAERDRIIHAQDMALRMLESGSSEPHSGGGRHGSAQQPPVGASVRPDLVGTPSQGETPKNAPIWQRLLGRKL